jgi:DNA modification methylase
MPSKAAAPTGGQVHRVGRQTVHLGDARSMTGVASGSVALFVTSPPYWNLKDYGGPDQIGRSGYADYIGQLNRVWDECYRCGAPGSVLVVNVNSRRHEKTFYPIAFDVVAAIRGWRLWDHVVWYVPNALPQPNHYRERLLDNKHESCLVFTKDGSTAFKFHKPRVPQKYITADPRGHKKNARGRCLGNVIRVPAYRPPNVKELGYHVAAFPEELVAFFVACYTDPGDTVLDPFLGSGTTLKVCETMGRVGIGYEINRDYLPLIERRVLEPWAVPDWRDLDILHSATMSTGSLKPRKVQFLRDGGKRRGRGRTMAPSNPEGGDNGGPVEGES